MECKGNKVNVIGCFELYNILLYFLILITQIYIKYYFVIYDFLQINGRFRGMFYRKHFL